MPALLFDHIISFSKPKSFTYFNEKMNFCPTDPDLTLTCDTQCPVNQFRTNLRGRVGLTFH